MDKNQGYEIIKAVMLENGRGFALGHHPTAPSPYVTWACYDDKDGQRQYEWGHYGSDRTALEQALIADRMAEAGISNMGAYMRKMALNGYVLHVDLSDIRELVALQRRCANNLNQVAVHANTYGIYPSEIAALQKDYADLWEPLSELLKKLSAVVSL